MVRNVLLVWKTGLAGMVRLRIPIVIIGALRYYIKYN